MCRVHPMLPVCLYIVNSLLLLWFSLTFICPVSSTPNVTSVSIYCQFFIAPLVFSNFYLPCVEYTKCCQCVYILSNSLLLLWFSLTFICPVSSTPNVASVSIYCQFLIAPLVFSNVYLPCVEYTQCCQCVYILSNSLLLLQFSLTFICHVSSTPNVASVSIYCLILDSPFSFL